MSRTSRKLLNGKICHHIVQGINKEYIFKEKEDKNKYLNLLKKYYIEYKIDIISYCIMDNHTHLILYSDNIKNISAFMGRINSIYAMYYNKKYNRVGYVFRNRFKSILIKTREQLCICIKYIHMNPVRAKIVEKEGEYKYSSYNDYLNKSGFLNQRILDFLFSKSQNYIEEFKSIPYKNIYDNKIILESALNQFLNQENTNFYQVKVENDVFEKFIIYLNLNNYSYTMKELADVLNIGKTTIYRKVKKVPKNGKI